MMQKLVAFFFYGNYYIGVLAVLLAIETAFQLHISIAPVEFYALLFSVTTGYYTYAYSWLPQQYYSSNPRTKWYENNRKTVNASLVLWSILFVVSAIRLLVLYHGELNHISILYWTLFGIMILSGIFYYGILPQSFFNLRNTGWLKAFTIGFTWASCVTYMPIMMHRWISGQSPAFYLSIWFFMKNWVFCTINAIMFDIKDYEDDTNRQLKTFMVRVGLSKTMYFILLPLILVGLLSFLLFAWKVQMPWVRFVCNLIPFVLCFAIWNSLKKNRSLLFYLIVIDGILIVKAICGILGVILSTPK